MSAAKDPYGMDPRTECFPSGCTLLDCILGGGWALGRIGNIVGDKSTGKTLLAIESCANFAQAFPTGRIVYIEAEAAFDKGYARSLGLPISRVEFPEDVETVEQWFAVVDGVVTEQEAKEKKRKKGDPQHTLIIMDSIDALGDEAEDKTGFGEGSYSLTKVKQIRKVFRRLTAKLERFNVTMILISQVGDNIGVSFGKQQRRSGGKALDFFASQVMWLAHIKRIQGGTKNGHKRDIGVVVKAKMEKNKVAPPFRECEFPIMFGYGADDAKANLRWLLDFKEHSPMFSSIEKTKETLKGLDDLSDKAYTKLTIQLRAYVKKKWRAVEKTFAPTRSKYLHGPEEEESE